MNFSTSVDCRSKNIRILPIVISELELGDIERHIFAAHFVECADYAALEDRPEAFDGLGVNRADDILALGMVNNAVRIFAVKSSVSGPLVSTKQANFMRDRFADEGGESFGIHVCDHARDYIAFAADCANDWSFAGTNTAGSAAAALIPMPVLGQAANESFIDLDDTAELSNIFHKRDADLVTHGPCCFIRAEAHIALNLQRAHALFAGQHQMDDAIPIAQRLIGILDYCSGNMRKAIAI